MHWHHVEYADGDRVLLSMHDLKLQGPRKFRDRLIGLLRVIELIGNAVYCLDLAGFYAVHGMHNVFHVLLLNDW